MAPTSLASNIPGDVSVIGYDDIELAGYTFPPLTTVRQPAAEIGAAAANAVIDHLDNDLALPNAVALKPELIVRHRSGRGLTHCRVSAPDRACEARLATSNEIAM